MSAPTLEFVLVKATTTDGLSPRMEAKRGKFDPSATAWKRALERAGFRPGDRVVLTVAPEVTP